jgi:hypothetical protein
VNDAIAIDDGIAVRRKRAAQSYVGIERAGLVEVDDAQPVGAANLPPVGSQLSLQQAQQRGLAAAIRADEADAHSGGEDEVEAVE